MKPLGATVRASYRSPFAVRKAKFLTTIATRYDSQDLLHCDR
jgi:hypothetical protein